VALSAIRQTLSLSVKKANTRLQTGDFRRDQNGQTGLEQEAVVMRHHLGGAEQAIHHLGSHNQQLQWERATLEQQLSTQPQGRSVDPDAAEALAREREALQRAAEQLRRDREALQSQPLAEGAVPEAVLQQALGRMQQEYQQTGAWPSESEVAKRVEEDLRTLYQSLKDVYDDGLSAPVPSYEPPTLSSDQGGAVSAPRTAEPRVTDPRDLQSPAYMQALWRQVRNKR